MTLSDYKRANEADTEGVRVAGLAGMDPIRFRLALAQLAARLCGARRRFRSVTGLTAVTSLRRAGRDPSELEPLSPPLHPQCAERLRTVSRPPCEEQWRHHVLASRRSERSHSHTCPIGLRCSCVPVYLSGVFVGVAKLVADPCMSALTFSDATAALALTISLSCHQSYMSVLRAELQALRQRVRGASQVEPSVASPATATRARAVADSGSTVPSATIVDRALDYLHAHYHDPDLSLRMVAAAVGCNANYLSHLFTQRVGQRMHGYLVGLRVDRARREILRTDGPLKQIAYDAGFGDAGQLARTFHRHVGVTPSAYRCIFAAPNVRSAAEAPPGEPPPGPVTTYGQLQPWPLVPGT